MTALSKLTSCRTIRWQGDNGKVTDVTVMWYAGANKCEGVSYYQTVSMYTLLGSIAPILLLVFLTRERAQFKRNRNKLIDVEWYAVATKSFSADCWYYELVLIL